MILSNVMVLTGISLFRSGLVQKKRVNGTALSRLRLPLLNGDNFQISINRTEFQVDCFQFTKRQLRAMNFAVRSSSQLKPLIWCTIKIYKLLLIFIEAELQEFKANNLSRIICIKTEHRMFPRINSKTEVIHIYGQDG